MSTNTTRDFTLDQNAADLDVKDLQGGGNSKFLLFNEGVNYKLPSEKKVSPGRIMPAFKAGMSPADSAFAASVNPYRIAGVIDDKTEKNMGNPVFSNFYVAVFGYRFLGNGGLSFLSPKTLAKFASNYAPEETADPVSDMWNAAHKDDRFKALTEKPTDGKDRYPKPAIPRHAKTFVLFNWYGTDEFTGKTMNQILVSSGVALEHLQGELCQYRNPKMVARDKVWDSFLFGDVTHPETGLLAKLTPLPMPTGGGNFIGFKWAPGANSSAGCQVFPVDEAILSQRYDLRSGKVLRIDSYQGIVDMLRGDGAFPLELIKLACGHNANVGGSPALGTPSTLSSVEDPDDQLPGLEVEKPATYPMPAPAAASVAPVLPLGKFWVAPAGQSTLSTLHTAEQVLALVVDGKAPRVCAEGTTDWRKAVDYGIVAPAPVAPTAPPEPPVAPTAPPEPPVAPPEPPVAPTAPPEPPVAPVEVQPTASADWTTGDEARYSGLLARSSKPKEQGGLTQEELTELMTLNGRRAQAQKPA